MLSSYEEQVIYFSSSNAIEWNFFLVMIQFRKSKFYILIHVPLLLWKKNMRTWMLGLSFSSPCKFYTAVSNLLRISLHLAPGQDEYPAFPFVQSRQSRVCINSVIYVTYVFPFISAPRKIIHQFNHSQSRQTLRMTAPFKHGRPWI